MRLTFSLLILNILIASMKVNSVEWVNYNSKNSNLPHDYIYNFVIDSDDKIWIATGGGICIYYDGNFEIPTNINSQLPSTNTTNIFISNSGKIYIGTSEGFCIYSNESLVCFNSSNSILPRDFILSISDDYDDNIWIGTGKGVLKINDAQWEVYNISNSVLPSNIVSSFHKNNFNKEFWIGTAGGAIKIFNGQWKRYDASNSKLTQYPIWAIASKDNEISFGCNKLVKYKNEMWEAIPDDSLGLGITDIRGLAYDLKGNLYVGTWWGGISVYDGNYWKYFNAGNSSLTTNDISSIIVDRFNNKWIGTNDQGIFIYNEDGIKFSSISEASIKDNIEIVNIETINNTINLELFNPFDSDVFVNVYDLLGKRVFHSFLGYYLKGQYNKTIKSLNMSSGLYLLVVNNSYNADVKLFFIQK